MNDIRFENNENGCDVYCGSRFLFSRKTKQEAIKELKSQLTY